MYHRTGGFTGHEREVYKSLVFCHFHEGRVIKPDFLEDEPNIRNIFAAIGFDCLLDLDEQICLIFVLQFYKSVRVIRNLNGTISIAFVNDNVETTLTFENFAWILKIPGEETLQSCLLHRHRMVSVTQSSDMTLPYVMLLTRLYKHVRANHPYTMSNEFQLVDHVMIPLSNKRVFRFKTKGKRPRLPTPTPPTSESSSSSVNQEVSNDPVDNYTLDPIPYLNQLPPIEGGESPEFKQTKGMNVSR
ncbi:hypothetical protein Tco_0718527 [Tanacetum coccineum]